MPSEMPGQKADNVRARRGTSTQTAYLLASGLCLHQLRETVSTDLPAASRGRDTGSSAAPIYQCGQLRCQQEQNQAELRAREFPKRMFSLLDQRQA